MPSDNEHLNRQADSLVNTGSVTVVFVTFNSSEVIKAAIQAATECADVASIIVVDNASQDSTAQLIGSEFPEVQLVRNTANVGFGQANNIGLKLVRTEFALALNPDALVSNEAIASLVKTANAYPNAAIVGPKLVEDDGPVIVRTGSVESPAKTRIPSDTEVEVEFLSGAAMLLRMSHFSSIGFFDPRIFLFYEDDDICMSARNAGFSLIFSSKAKIAHSVGKSSGSSVPLKGLKQCHFTWSRIYIEQKQKGVPAAMKLAAETKSSLNRKMLAAKILRNKTKQQLIGSRILGVRTFLEGRTPPTSADYFTSQNPDTDPRNRTPERNGQMELTACDLCESTSFELIADKDRHGQHLDTAICRNCGLVRHAQVPSELELQQFYSTTYRSDYNGESTPGPRRIMRAWNNGLRICSQVAPLLENNSRVLEVGAGIGCTVKVFEKAGFAAEGIDPGGEFLKFSRDKLNANVEIKNLYDLPKNQNYDAVLLVHVIEHLRSPKEAFNYIAGLIKPGGMFYVECPNLQAPFARRSKLFHTAHIHNYVPSTLQMLGESCGFRLRKRFGDDQDPNLQMLFQHLGDKQLNLDKDNYQRTVSDLNRSNPLPYHTRWRYVTDRLSKLRGYADEHRQAKKFVANLIRECSEGAAVGESKKLSHVA